MKKFKMGTAGYLILSVLLVVGTFSLMFYGKSASSEKSLYNDYKTVSVSDAQTAISSDNVKSAIVVGNTLYYITNNGTKCSVNSSDDMVSILEMNGVISNSQTTSTTSTASIISIVVVMLLLIAFFGSIFFVGNILKGLSGIIKSGSNEPANPFKQNNGSIITTRPTVTFADVQGLDPLKEDLERIVNSLKNPSMYTDIGARMIKGVILYGPPGTGKTLTAKAIAGTADVPFLSASGSDFIEKYVGVGASRIRELYATARKHAPCIVFIDEIDAIGGQRGDNSSSTERDQTINALLTELDGFNGSEGILTICATNRLDMLDSALTRPGRFDLQLAVSLPDREGRLAILQHHAKGKRISMDVNLSSLAARTVGFSGADLESLLNESAHIAVAAKRHYITDEDIDDAFFKIIMKGNKKKKPKDSNDLKEMIKLVAWHEAGHALVDKLLTDDSVPSVTIIGSTSGAGGVTFRSPKENKLRSKEYLRNTIKVSYAGRAAEEILFNDPDKVTTGASQDIKQATSIILDYIGSFGMGSYGMLDIKMFSKGDTEVFNEAKKMADELYKQTLQLLNSNVDTLEAIANALIEKETLTEEDLDAIIRKNSNPMSTGEVIYANN